MDALPSGRIRASMRNRVLRTGRHSERGFPKTRTRMQVLGVVSVAINFAPLDALHRVNVGAVVTLLVCRAGFGVKPPGNRTGRAQPKEWTTLHEELLAIIITSWFKVFRMDHAKVSFCAARKRQVLFVTADLANVHCQMC